MIEQPASIKRSSPLTDGVLKAASQTLLTIAADPKHLGARTGLTTVLHTWGSAMTHYPHLDFTAAGYDAW